MFDIIIEVIIFGFLFGIMYINEFYGAIVVVVLFSGFIVIVANSNKYPQVNHFFDTIF